MAFTSIDDHQLSYQAIGDIHRHEPLIFLHGIMGNKKNLRGFAQRMVEVFPHYSALIFDVRNHGESSKHWAPFTVEAAAKDIVLAADILQVVPKKIIGHSFSGKVALVAAMMMPKVEQVWLLDCPLGPIEKKLSLNDKQAFSALEVLELLESMSFPYASRQAVMDALLKASLPENLALWMSTNLTAHESGFYLVFEPQELRAMLLDFIALDLWPQAENMGNKALHVVAAERGYRLNAQDKKKIEHLKNGFFHVLNNSGHFVHVDNREGLVDLFRPYLDQ